MIPTILLLVMLLGLATVETYRMFSRRRTRLERAASGLSVSALVVLLHPVLVLYMGGTMPVSFWIAMVLLGASMLLQTAVFGRERRMRRELP